MLRFSQRTAEISILILGGLVAVFAAGESRSKPPLQLVGTIPMLKVEGRLDHLAVDVKGKRLFVAALGNNTVEVIDLKAGQRIASLNGFVKPQGVLFVPELGKLFVASNDGSVRVFRGDSLEPVGKFELSPGADNIGYDTRSKELYVGHGGKEAGRDYGDFAILNPSTGKLIETIRTEARPGSFAFDVSRPRIFLNVPLANQIVVIDRHKRKVTSQWPLNEAHLNVTLALDSAGHRLFVAARLPPRLIVFDTESGNQVASLVTDGDADDLFFDAALKRVYLSCGEGFINVFQQHNPDLYTPIAKIPTRLLARTSLFVPEFGRYYVATPRYRAMAAEIRVYEVQP